MVILREINSLRNFFFAEISDEIRTTKKQTKICEKLSKTIKNCFKSTKNTMKISKNNN